MLLLLSALCATATLSAKPNILFIVIDDLGFDDVGFRSHEIKTPTIDKLASAGRVLDQYYVQDVCSPSRATFMTGRFAMHHTIVDWIPPASAYGLPLNETTLADKMKEAGYATHASGKWHLGFYKWAMTPTFRGFDSFVGFYSGGEDYFTHQSSGGYDFRRDPTPKCGQGCSQVDYQDNGRYSTTAFTTEAVRVIAAHNFSDASTPLFLYLAYQGVHAPAEVPEHYADAYKTTIADDKRRVFAGMLSAVDEGIANTTSALAAAGATVLDNTVIVFTADNGGPTTTGDGVGARNWPLKGGKHSIWEGGTRVTGFVTGYGIAPSGSAAGIGANLFGGLMHGADWLPTLSTVAGYSLTGTLPLDGVDQWALITGATAVGTAGVGRTTLVIGNSTNMCSWPKSDNRYHGHATLANAGADLPAGAVVPAAASDVLGCGFATRLNDGNNKWKLIKGYGGGPDTWCNKSSTGDVCAPNGPTATAWVAAAAAATAPPAPPAPPAKPIVECPNGYCLFDVESDPFEEHEISASHPDVVARMKAAMDVTLLSYRQYSEDPECPPHKFVNNSQVGDYWAPWC